MAERTCLTAQLSVAVRPRRYRGEEDV